MNIHEVTQRARVTRSTGNQVTVDHGNGTQTTVDTRKNPNAISRGEDGKLKIQTQQANSRMNGNNKNNQNNRPKPGEEIEIDEADNVRNDPTYIAIKKKYDDAFQKGDRAAGKLLAGLIAELFGNEYNPTIGGMIGRRTDQTGTSPRAPSPTRPATEASCSSSMKKKKRK